MSPYQYETVKVEVSAEGVAHVQLHRPKKLNAFNDQSVQCVHSGGEMRFLIRAIYYVDLFLMSERHSKTFLSTATYSLLLSLALAACLLPV